MALVLAAALIGFSQAELRAAEPFGAFGPEAQRMREQLWVVPGGDPKVPLRATLFRPPQTAELPTGQLVPVADAAGATRRPLVIINHGSDDRTRESVSMPVFYWLSRWFVERGYVVLVPQRRGHGSTGGPFAEGRDSCSSPDHHGMGQAAADDIEAAVRYMAQQPFVDASNIVVAGISSGGWASLALAGRNIPGLRLVVNFAGGRGGHAYGRAHSICNPGSLIDATEAFARKSSVPTIWFYSRNDSYFGPDLATAMSSAWRRGGGAVDFHMLPDYGNEGHFFMSDRASWQLFGPRLEASLAEIAKRNLQVAACGSGSNAEASAAQGGSESAKPVSQVLPGSARNC